MATVEFPLDDIQRAALRAQGRLEERRRDLLDVLGTTILSESQLAYRTKARGGRGSDGITWKKLSPKTLEARVRRRAPARRIVRQRKKLAEKIRNTKGKGSGKKKEGLRKKRKDQLEKLQSLIQKEVNQHEIGVDTGLQRASASPGFRARDGRGGNTYEFGPDRITVGYNRKYSTFFDEARPLLPDPLPQAWQQELDQRTEEFMQRLLERDFG